MSGPPREPSSPGSPRAGHFARNNDLPDIGESLLLGTAHCTIVATDIVGFGQNKKSNREQVRIRHGMYEAMHTTFDAVGIPWSACWLEDRGDGVFLLAPADVPKRLFADHLPDALADELATHNRGHRPQERIELRLALHAGEVNFDRHGVTGLAINHTYRLLNSDVLKHALKSSRSAVLAIISSAWFYEDVIQQNELSPKAYREVDVTNKETQAKAWIRLVTSPAVQRRQAPPRSDQSA
jgi:hypothetical protein